jgi:signal transduction histidine kinase
MKPEHIMKGSFTTLSRCYAAALRKYLQHGPPAGLHSLRKLGRQAVSLGLETLDMAKIHDGALATLPASGNRDGTLKRAQTFFTEAVIPIEQTHRAERKAHAHLTKINKSLDRRTADLAASNRSLKQSIVHRRTVEGALKKSGGQSKKLLAESRRLQSHLRAVTHQMLTAQEHKRKKISRDLQDEIAQTLLGINVRLLALKKEAVANANNFKQAVAHTQRLVERSVKTIKRFAREFGRHHET